MPLHLPHDIIDWVRSVFRECNFRVTEKLSPNPNIPEESLDMTWIEHLSHHSAPVMLPSGWTVQIETHFLGGLRHWNRWEIADIGLLLFARPDYSTTTRKVALLQSKRLYPTTAVVGEESTLDYEIGFARLADPEILAQPLAFERVYEFTADCRYGALKAGSRQVQVMDEYQEAEGIHVYYQLYNPWSLPFSQRVPIQGRAEMLGDMSHGSRIVPATNVHGFLQTKADGYKPSPRDLANAGSFGWALEEFIADEWLACREGDPFESTNDQPIQRLFFRRTGPIAAAMSIRAEGPAMVR